VFLYPRSYLPPRVRGRIEGLNLAEPQPDNVILAIGAALLRTRCCSRGSGHHARPSSETSPAAVRRPAIHPIRTMSQGGARTNSFCCRTNGRLARKRELARRRHLHRQAADGVRRLCPDVPAQRRVRCGQDTRRGPNEVAVTADPQLSVAADRKPRNLRAPTGRRFQAQWIWASHRSPGRAGEIPPTTHPVVRTHPKRRQQPVSQPRRHADASGLTHTKAATLLDLLYDQIQQPHFLCAGTGGRGTMAFWDNSRKQQYTVGDDAKHERVIAPRATI